MRCEDLQIDLASYMDDALSEENIAVLRSHFSECPLCRQALDDMRKAQVGLRSLPRPEIPHAIMASVRRSVREKAEPASQPFGIFSARLNVPSYRLWLASYTVGACASVVFGMAFLWLIFLANVNAGRSSFASIVSPSLSSPVQVAPGLDSTRVILSPKDFANTRLDIAAVSPSVNPQGSLIELTKSLVNNEGRNDEVVVVADVFGNGSAQIAEVVEPSRNQNAVPELARALDYETVNPPFVPATFDQRSDTIRVVLKIQSVDVSTREPSKKRRSL
jgi:hypothetical protein